MTHASAPADDGTGKAHDPAGQRYGPLTVAAVTAMAAMLFVTIRLLVPAHGDISRFVVAGTMWADPSQTPTSLHVFDSDGYDGQFFWRMAVDPTHLTTDRHLGVEVDQPLRFQRPGYPLLAWVLSFGGNVSLVPWALVIVNVGGLTALGWLGGRIASDAGRSAWWGLVVAGVPGFAMALSRDLSDVLGAALFLGGIVAARRGRWWLVVGLWSFGVVTREQMLVPIVAFALWRVVAIAQRRVSVSTADVAWLAPGAVFVVWQVGVWSASGRVPLTSSTGNNVAIPFTGVIGGVITWVSALADGPKELGTGLVTLLELVALTTLVALALRIKPPAERGYERWMLVALAVLGLSLSRAVWDAPADLRTLADLSVLAWILLLTDRLRRTNRLLPLPLLVGLQTVAFAGAAAIRLVSI